MGNISDTYASVFTQCIRRRNSQQLIDIDSDDDFDNDEKIIFYKPKKNILIPHTHTFLNDY